MKTGRQISPNVLFLTVDAVRPDHLGLYGYNRKTDEALSPFWDRVTFFTHAFTYGMPTIRAFPAIIASIWPSLCKTKFPWQYMKYADLPEKAKTLAEVFSEAGYQCSAHTCWSNFLTAPQGYDRGFQSYVGMMREDGQPPAPFFDRLTKQMIYGMRYFPSEKGVLLLERSFHWFKETINSFTGGEIKEPAGLEGRLGENVTNYLINQIEHRDPRRPFFIWGQFHDAHMPWNSNSKFSYNCSITAEQKRTLVHAILKQKPLTPEHLSMVVDLYDSGIHYTFAQIRRIFDYLQTANIFDNTIVIILSDHGYGLWEHNYWETPENKFFNESVRVPLMIFNSQKLTPGKDERLLSLMDLSPTVIDLCDMQPEEQFFGSSFLNTTAPLPVWLETIGPPRCACLISTDRKIVFDELNAQVECALTLDDTTVKLSMQEEEDFFKTYSAYVKRKYEFQQKLANLI